jgi:hypothetical protein
MNAQQLRGWLLQLPKPATVRVMVNGEAEDLQPGKSWQKLADTIVALDPEAIQALDKDGKILRAKRLDDEDSRRSDAAAIPQGLAADPHALMLTHFANLIHRAYEHSTEVAFAKLSDITDRMNERSEAIEQRLERAEARARRIQDEQIDDAYARAEEIAAQAVAGGNKEELGMQMLNMFLQARGGLGGMAGAAAAAGAANTNAAPSKANGKGAH